MAPLFRGFELLCKGEFQAKLQVSSRRASGELQAKLRGELQEMPRHCRKICVTLRVPREDAARLVVDYAASSLLELLSLALVDRPPGPLGSLFGVLLPCIGGLGDATEATHHWWWSGGQVLLYGVVHLPGQTDVAHVVIER